MSKVTIRTVPYDYQKTTGTSPSIPWLMLHGFTGTKKTFHEIVEKMPNETILTLDLIGHGDSFSDEVEESRYKIDELCLDIKLLLDELNIEKVNLLGYSMGGRVALAFSVHYPEKVAKLILESSSPGLKTEQDRDNRQKSDAKLAAFILNEGMNKFVAKWESLPLFATQEKLTTRKKVDIQQERLHQQPLGLANSLLQMGTGSQPSYWEELPELKMPVYLLIGSLDEKFKKIAKEMNRLLTTSTLIKFSDAGHAIHLEKPAEFAAELKKISFT